MKENESGSRVSVTNASLIIVDVFEGGFPAVLTFTTIDSFIDYYKSTEDNKDILVGRIYKYEFGGLIYMLDLSFPSISEPVLVYK